MHLRALIVATAVLLALATTASADDISVGGRTLSIMPPEGYCALDRSNPADARVMDTVEKAQAGRNQVLMHFVPCTELEDWHAGRIAVYSVYGNVAVQLNNGTPTATRMSRTDFIDGMQAHMPTLDMKDIESEVNSKIEGMQLSGSQMLGVIDKDSNALYVALAMEVSANGENLAKSAVTTFTLLGPFVANTNMATAAMPGAYDRLLAIQKTYLANLVQQNH
jgi:hypothetical protein